jgi:hypothetical protein
MSALRSVTTAAVLLVTVQRAYTEPPSIDATQFHPTATGEGYGAVDGAFTLRHLGVGAGLYANYAHRPLVLRDAGGAVPPGGEVIGHQLTLDLVASFALFERFEVGINLPLVPHQVVDNSALQLEGGLSTWGLGDLRFDAKVRAAFRGWSPIGDGAGWLWRCASARCCAARASSMICRSRISSASGWRPAFACGVASRRWVS